MPKVIAKMAITERNDHSQLLTLTFQDGSKIKILQPPDDFPHLGTYPADCDVCSQPMGKRQVYAERITREWRFLCAECIEDLERFWEEGHGSLTLGAIEPLREVI